jgi:Glycosyl Hydrolase Family 88.
MKTLITPFLFAVLLLLQSCNTGKPEDIVAENFDFAAQQLLYAIELTDEAIRNDTRDSVMKANRPLVSPRTTNEDGSLKVVPARDWTSGFFPGELWFMYEYTKDPKWEEFAVRFTAPLEGLRHHKGTHDLGFMVNNSFGHGQRLSGRTEYKDIILDAALSLSSRYKPDAKVIRSWDHNRDKWQCPVIIDNMMNLELLFWAFKESGDSTFYTIAVNHANTTMKNHFREDYGTWHVIDYDTITGEVLHRNTHQGYADESTWSRGEAWALYGYTMTYRETKDEAYLTQARNIADFIFSHPNLPEDLIPYWDFNAPEIPNEPRDVSAATITASALYELSLYGGEKAGQYKKWADTVMENLTDTYKASLHSDAGFLLLHSTGAKSLNSEIDVPIVYADYYFLEALVRKMKIENNQALF